jgi:hypothetical protein
MMQLAFPFFNTFLLNLTKLILQINNVQDVTHVIFAASGFCTTNVQFIFLLHAQWAFNGKMPG